MLRRMRSGGSQCQDGVSFLSGRRTEQRDYGQTRHTLVPCVPWNGTTGPTMPGSWRRASQVGGADSAIASATLIRPRCVKAWG